MNLLSVNRFLAHSRGQFVCQLNDYDNEPMWLLYWYALVLEVESLTRAHSNVLIQWANS